jgi:hypothetical protein
MTAPGRGWLAGSMIAALLCDENRVTPVPGPRKLSTGVAQPEAVNSPARILSAVSSEDRGEQVAETFLEFRATSRVVHFDTLAFATDQAGLAQDFEMLGEGRLGQGAVFDLAEVGAIQGAF